MTTPATAALWVVRRRGWIVVAWIVACSLLLPMARSIDSALTVGARIEGSESAEVAAALEHRFGSPFAQHVLLVVSGIPSPTQAAGQEALGMIVDAVRTVPGVTRVVSYLDGRDLLFVGAQPEGATFAVVGLAPTARPDALLEPMRTVTRQLAGQLRPRFPAVSLRWTGESALNADLRMESATAAAAAERRALPVIAVLLVIAFGALAAAVLPVLAGPLAIGITLGLATFVARAWPLSILLQSVVTLIGLGLAIDYSLLIVSRFRDELATGKLRLEAATAALQHAGPTIVLSGAAVAIGFGALATSRVNELRSVAVAGLLVVVVSVLVATTLLPSLLAMLGRHVDAGRVRVMHAHGTPRWARWARFVTTHPVRVLLICLAPIALLALQATYLRIELPRGDWLPREMESAQGLRTLDAMGRGAVVQTIRVILALPTGSPALGEVGWAATARLARAIASDPTVSDVRSLPGFVDPLSDRLLLPREFILKRMPADFRRAFVSGDDRLALLEVVPRDRVTQVELRTLVHRLRAIDVAATAGIEGSRLAVGGLPAFNDDYRAAASGRFFQVVALIVTATFAILAVTFRSVLIPLKAIVLNLLAVAAAFGALVLVFQEGIGAALLGLQGPLDGVFPSVPVMAFCIVFGLSMDYEIFLVARVREARRAGLDEGAAVAEGLVQTGHVITCAAAIMIVVFAAFTLADFLLIKMLGFTLAVAVFLDATLMRLAISPALLTLAGRWNWWPGERGRCGWR